MQYFGGKHFTAKKTTDLIMNMMSPGQEYIEPFVGAAWIVSNMKAAKKSASDTNPYLIELYKALQNNWMPPADVGEELYVKLRKCTGKQKQDGPMIPLEDTKEYLFEQEVENENVLALIGFAGCACSFAGIWYGSYARDPRHLGMNFAEKGQKTLHRLRAFIRDVEFSCKSYDEWEPEGAMVYCDPPYNATNQPYFSKVFDSDHFWETMRQWSKNNTVLISEYNAPDDFPVIASLPTKTKIDCKSAADARRAENIYSLTPYDPFQGAFD